MTLLLLTVEQIAGHVRWLWSFILHDGTRRVDFDTSDRIASVSRIEFLRYSYDKRGRFNDIAISSVQTHGDEQLVNSPSLSFYLVKDRASEPFGAAVLERRMNLRRRKSTRGSRWSQGWIFLSLVRARNSLFSTSGFIWLIWEIYKCAEYKLHRKSDPIITVCWTWMWLFIMILVETYSWGGWSASFFF